ncbi:UNVERIFIED_CONTAM: hypothetical protein NCL1_25182 [Trichonephila clavipes]
MTPELAPPSLVTTTPHHGRTFELSTDLTCIAPLYGFSQTLLYSVVTIEKQTVTHASSCVLLTFFISPRNKTCSFHGATRTLGLIFIASGITQLNIAHYSSDRTTQLVQKPHWEIL